MRHLLLTRLPPGVVKEVLNDIIVIVENSVENVSLQSHNILPPCECKMKKRYEKIDKNSRKIIHDNYWGIDEYARRLWVQNHVTFNEPK